MAMKCMWQFVVEHVLHVDACTWCIACEKASTAAIAGSIQNTQGKSCLRASASRSRRTCAAARSCFFPCSSSSACRRAASFFACASSAAASAWRASARLRSCVASAAAASRSWASVCSWRSARSARAASALLSTCHKHEVLRCAPHSVVYLIAYTWTEWDLAACKTDMAGLETAWCKVSKAPIRRNRTALYCSETDLCKSQHMLSRALALGLLHLVIFGQHCLQNDSKRT